MYVQSILEEEKEEIPCLLYLIQIFGLTVVAIRSNVNIRAIQILSVPRHYMSPEGEVSLPKAQLYFSPSP